MKILVSALWIGAVSVTAASAAPYAHHRVAAHRHASVPRAYVRYAPPPYYGAQPYYPYGYVPYAPAYDWSAAEILRRTAEAQHEPGVTSELAPDAKQTASGGPVGGIPGFSGGGR